MLLAASCSLTHPLTEANNSLADIGKPAPEFSGTDIDGQPIKLSDFKGHPVLLNFWASWCGPCRAEQPGLVDLAQSYQSTGLVVVGIDIRDQVEQARIFRDEFKVPYRSIYDQAARLAYAYQIDAPPGTALIDAKGVVDYHVTGGLSEDSLKTLLRERLGLSP